MRSLIAVVSAMVMAAPAQAAVPEVIKARVNALVATCAGAGGELGSMEGQGKFVIPGDFNGDRKTDFVISEGNFPCTGKPALFRPGGEARLELYLGDGGDGAVLVFADRLIAYRIVAGAPAKLQIARKGARCGGGPAAKCGAELRWNAAAERFDEVGTGASGGASVAAVRPAVIDGAVVAPVAVASSAAPAGAAAAAAPLPVMPGAREAFLAGCRSDLKARYPNMTKANIDSSCVPGWDLVVAAGPMADAVLAAVPARAGEALTVPALKSRLPQLRWLPVKAAPKTPVARLGALEVTVDGVAPAKAISFHWSSADGEGLAYDLPGALAARGAKVTPLGCYNFGAAEVTRAYAVTAPGRPPFGVEVSVRTAAMANQQSFQGMSADLTGKVPTLASLKAQYRDPPWQAVCEF